MLWQFGLDTACAKILNGKPIGEIFTLYDL